MNNNSESTKNECEKLEEKLIITTQGKEGVDYIYDSASQTITLKCEKPVSISGSATSPINILIDGKPKLKIMLNELITKVANEEIIKGELVLTTIGIEGLDYTYDEEHKCLTIMSNTPITVGGFTIHPVNIEIKNTDNAHVTLNNLSTAADSVFKVCEGAKATIVLKNENQLNRDASSTGGGSGLFVNGEAVLEGKGSLLVQGGTTAAGIGGYDGKSGQITINGGRITAFGGWCAAGIGGGGSGDFHAKHSAGTVIVNGGSIRTSYIGGNETYAGKIHQGYFGLVGNGVLHTNDIAVGSKEITSGVLFMKESGTIYGSPVIDIDWEILENEILTIEEGKELIINEGTILTIYGTLIIKGKFINNGTIKKVGKIEFCTTGCLGGSGKME